MSYSSQTKEELCRFEPDSVCCLLAELSGIVCAAGSVIYRGGGEKRLSIETENNAVARRAFRLLREGFDVQPQLVTLKRSRLGGRSAYRKRSHADCRKNLARSAEHIRSRLDCVVRNGTDRRKTHAAIHARHTR